MAEAGDNGGPKFVYGGEGWIAMHRTVRDHWLVGFGNSVKPMDASHGSHSRNEAFTDLIMECRYEAGSVMNGGRKMEIKPGQLVGAISWLANRWNWTPQTVRTFLEKLQNDNMIERNSATKEDENNKQKNNQSSVITICNYEKYQFLGDEEKQVNQQASNKPATSQQQASNNNTKDNKGIKEQEERPPNPQGGTDDHLPKTVRGRDVARAAFVEWQDFATAHGLACPKDSTFDTFAKTILARMTEHADTKTRDGMLAVWRVGLGHVAKSKFLRGMSDHEFRADLGMITRPKNFAKLISGGYGNGAHASDPRWALPAADGKTTAAIPVESRDDLIAKFAAEGIDFIPGDM